MARSPQSQAERERERAHKIFLAAVNFGDVEKVRALLASGAIDVNHVEPKTGLTALHIAAGRGAAAVVRLLIQTGRCDLTIKDGKGRTAGTVAVTVGRDPALGRYLFDLQYGSGVARLRRRGGGEQAESELDLD